MVNRYKYTGELDNETYTGFIVTKSTRQSKIKKDISKKLNINFASWDLLIIFKVNMPNPNSH